VLPKPLRTSASRAQPRINRTQLAPPDLTCSRENSREGGPSVLLSAVLATPDPTQPREGLPVLDLPYLAKSTLKRGQQREPKPPVLPSAAVAIARRSRPSLIIPCRAKLHPSSSGFQRTQQRGPKPSVLRSISVYLVLPHDAGSCRN
jgi:hypothetical protein